MAAPIKERAQLAVASDDPIVWWVLAQDGAMLVRMAVAGIPDLPVPIVDRLSRDPAWEVRWELARMQDDLPINLMARLLADEDPRVAAAAVRPKPPVSADGVDYDAHEAAVRQGARASLEAQILDAS